MQLGNVKPTTWNKDVNSQYKKVIPVNGPALSSHGESKARADTDGLQYSTLNPIQPSNRDTYQ